MSDLAGAFKKARRLAEAAAVHEDILKLQKARLGAGHPDTLRSMNRLAWALRDLVQVAKSIALLEATVKLARGRPTHPDTLDYISDLAVFYEEAGRLTDALPLYEEVLRLRKATLGLDHADCAMTIILHFPLPHRGMLPAESVHLKRYSHGDRGPTAGRGRTQAPRTRGPIKVTAPSIRAGGRAAATVFEP